MTEPLPLPIPESDAALVSAVAQLGVTREQVEECLRIQAGGSSAIRSTISEEMSDRLDNLRGKPLLQILVALSHLSATDAGRLEKSGAAQDRDPVAPSADRPVRKFGKYEIVRELGRGGMGVVYLAYHPSLKTHFAVKVLLAGDDASADAVRRFHQEAQASAKLRHPGMVAVHDIGEAEGKTYFAMEYVEGSNLERVLRDPVAAGLAPATGPSGPAPGLPARVAVRMTEEIAQAIQAAHEAGVIHRDLKPSNVLRDGAGRLKVMDFGLAKLVEAAGAGGTVTGSLMGTPAYMSPEQAEGRVREVDERSDVYQLGAILYELLTGRPPYGGETPIEIVLDVMRKAPPTPRRLNPKIDRDAETVCLKAMARDKGKRYGSARELAEDCRRFLDGDSVLARPEAWWERGARWAKRRKALTALAGAAMLAAVLAGVAGFRASIAEREREGEKLARETAEREKAVLGEKVLTELREKAGLYLDATLKLRRAGLSAKQAEQDYLPKLIAAVEEAEREMPDSPEPRFHLGRMYRALMQFERARTEQDKALARAPDYAQGLYERAILTAKAYGDRLSVLRADWISREGQRLAGAGMLEKGGLGGEKMKEMPGDDDLARDDAKAQALKRTMVADLERLETRVSDPEPSSISPGSLDCARGLFHFYRGRADEREQAQNLLRAAIEKDPLLEEAHEGLARLQVAANQLEDAIATYTRGMEMDKGYVAHLYGRAGAACILGTVKRTRGADPSELYGRAQADLGKALELDPGSADTWRHAGTLRLDWGTYRMSRGEDPGEVYGQAQADFGKALELDPGSAETWKNRGMVSSNWALCRQGRDEDPGELFGQAQADYGKALELDPDSAETWLRRGQVRTNLGTGEQGHGRDPGELYGQAQADFGKALELDPTSAETWMTRGVLRGNWGHYKQDHGEDPGELYAEAQADFGKALELNPDSAETWTSRGGVRKGWGAFRLNRGEDPGGLYSQAQADYGKSLELNPGSAETWERRGSLCVDWGNYRQTRGEDPGESYGQAQSDYGKALELNPRSAAVWSSRGRMRANWGRYRTVHGEDPCDLYGQAQSDYSKALELNPGSADVWSCLGSVRANWGRYQEDHGEDPGKLYGQAQADYSKALELNPGLAEAWAGRGLVREYWGTYQQAHAQDPIEIYAQALADYDRALEINPNSPEARWRRGWLRCFMMRWTEAIVDFEAAMRLNPASEPEFREKLAEARALLYGSDPAGPNPAWLASFRRADAGGDDYAARLRSYEEGLAALRKCLAILSESDRAKVSSQSCVMRELYKAHYNCAILVALALVGKNGPNDPAKTIPAAESAKLRDAAFEHLRALAQLACKEAGSFKDDPDFVPLHDDPRWKELTASPTPMGK